MTLRRLFGKKDAKSDSTRNVVPQISRAKSAEVSMEERSRQLQEKLNEMHDIVKELDEYNAQQREIKLFKKNLGGKSDHGTKKKPGFFDSRSEQIQEKNHDQEEELLLDKTSTGNAR